MFRRVFPIGLMLAALLMPISPSLAQTGRTPITPDNAGSLAESIRLGRGSAEFVRFTPDGSLILVGGSVGVWLYDVEGLATENEPAALLTSREPRAIAVSPDSSTVAIEHSGEITLWDIASQTATRVIDPRYSAANIAYSPDGSVIALNAGNNGIMLFDLATDTETQLEAALRSDAEISFSEDGQWLATVGSNHVIYVWDVANQTINTQLEGHTSSVTTVSISPDGKVVSGTNNRLIILWDGIDGTTIAEIGEIGDQQIGRVNQVIFSPDGAYFASGDNEGNIIIWDTATQTPQTQMLAASGVEDLVFSPDGTQLASTSRNNSVQLWDVSRGTELAASVGHTNVTNAITFSPDSGTLAISDNDENLWLWDVDGGAALNFSPVISGGGDIGGENITTVAYTADGSVLASIDSFSVTLYDASSHEVLQNLRASGIAKGLAFSPDDRLIVYSSSSGLYVFDVASGELLATLEDHNDWLNGIAWSPDQTMIATSSSDHTVRVYTISE